MKKLLNFKITEKQRTIILLCLLAFAIGFIIWTNSNYSENFTDSF